MSRIALTAIAIAALCAPAAAAEWRGGHGGGEWHGRGGGGGEWHERHHGGGSWIGPSVALGLGLGMSGGALAYPYYAPPPAYYPPPPVYYAPPPYGYYPQPYPPQYYPPPGYYAPPGYR